MAKAKTKAAPSVKITGANEADKANIAAARADNKADAEKAPVAPSTPSPDAAARTTRGDQTPEAQPTAREARDAAEAQFQKADEKEREGLLADAAARKAALGI